jgi:phage N-6-adenine-methyltransferase
MQGEQQIFGSSSVEWGTPPYLFDALDRIFHFDLDPASTDENAKTPRHYTAVDNGLVQPWDCEAFFVNPPYRRGKQGAGGWLAKGIETIQTYHNVGVYLLPVRTGTQWWVNHMYKAHEWWFIQGRVPFIGMAPADEEETEDGDDLLAELDVDPPSQEIVAKPKKRKIMPAPFDSVVAIFRYPLLVEGHPLVKPWIVPLEAPGEVNENPAPIAPPAAQPGVLPASTAPRVGRFLPPRSLRPGS